MVSYSRAELLALADALLVEVRAARDAQKLVRWNQEWPQGHAEREEHRPTCIPRTPS